MEKADLGSKNTTAILDAYQAGVFGKGTVLRELKQQSAISGMWTNITDQMIEDADKEDEEKKKQQEEEESELESGVNNLFKKDEEENVKNIEEGNKEQ